MKSYAEKAGLSPSRVTQLKQSLPIVEFDEIGQAFVDLDQLELEDVARKAAELEFSNREPLSTYTLAKLGDFFQGLIARLTRQATQSDQLREQAEERLKATTAELAKSREQSAQIQHTLDLTNQDIQVQNDRIENFLLQIKSLTDSTDQQQKALVEELRVANERIIKLGAEKQGLELTITTLKEVFEQTGKSESQPTKKAKSDKTKTN